MIGFCTQAREWIDLPAAASDSALNDPFERRIPGHWEGGIIKGKLNQSRFRTLVERKALFVTFYAFEHGSAKTKAEGLVRVLNRFDAQMWLSMTYDQGREMARHIILTNQAGVKLYFARPPSPVEAGH